MGSNADAVCDPELRVRGVDGLRIVDASVMPKTPRGNTNAPTIAVAERAADLIAEQLPPHGPTPRSNAASYFTMAWVTLRRDEHGLPSTGCGERYAAPSRPREIRTSWC
jgi:hypothetical protein